MCEGACIIMPRASIVDVIRNPYKIIKHLGGLGFFKWIPDETYLKMCYRGAFGKKLDLDNPQTFNEKLQWLKLNNRKQIYSTMVDKYEVKKYVADIIGEEYIIPTYGVWDSFDKIEFETLPNQFVLKCTHDSGGIYICKDKSKLDLIAAKKKIEKCLKRSFYYVGREWPYKNIKPRIIAEQYMEDELSAELSDYKLMCFNGRLRFTLVCQDRYSDEGLHESFFDNDWRLMPFMRHKPLCKGQIKRPFHFEQMKEFAEKLSADVPFLRVDFYEINGRLYFGELTLYPGNGFEEFIPESYDAIIGSWLELDTKHI